MVDTVPTDIKVIEHKDDPETIYVILDKEEQKCFTSEGLEGNAILGDTILEWTPTKRYPDESIEDKLTGVTRFCQSKTAQMAASYLRDAFPNFRSVADFRGSLDGQVVQVGGEDAVLVCEVESDHVSPGCSQGRYLVFGKTGLRLSGTAHADAFGSGVFISVSDNARLTAHNGVQVTQVTGRAYVKAVGDVRILEARDDAIIEGNSDLQVARALGWTRIRINGNGIRGAERSFETPDICLGGGASIYIAHGGPTVKLDNSATAYLVHASSLIQASGHSSVYVEHADNGIGMRLYQSAHAFCDNVYGFDYNDKVEISDAASIAFWGRIITRKPRLVVAGSKRRGKTRTIYPSQYRY